MLNLLPQLFNTWELEPARAMRERLKKALKGKLTEQEALAELKRINQRVLEIREDPSISDRWMERETRGWKDDLRACGYGPGGDEDG